MSEQEIKDAKASRKAHKSVVTKGIITIERLIVEQDIDEVKIHIQELKKKFRNFEAAHDKYHDFLTDDGLIDESDAYFKDVHDSYVKAFKEYMSWLEQQSKAVNTNGVERPVVENESGANDGRDSKSEMKMDAKTEFNVDTRSGEFLKIINMPNVEITEYKGDPMTFHSFFAIFDECVHNVDIDDAAKLIRLIGATKGDAYTAISHCMQIGGSKGYNEARQILESRFGNPLLISDRIICKLRSGKPVKSPYELQQLADELNSAYQELIQLNKLNEVDSQNCIMEIVNRLQQYLKNRWKKIALECKRDKFCYPNFKRLVDFVRVEADDAKDPLYGKFGSHTRSNDHQSSDSSKRHTSLVTSTGDDPSKSSSKSQHFCRSPCVVCKDNHRLFFCDQFKKMNVSDRIAVVKRYKLCVNCLLSNHDVADCRKDSRCTVPGCGLKHTKFIHVNENRSRGHSETSQQNVVSNQVKVKGENEVHLPVVSVIVNDTFPTYALLDTGSTNTFCTKDLVQELNVKGLTVSYNLNTLSCVNQQQQSTVVSLKLMSQDGSHSLSLSNVFVVDNIPVRSQNIDKAVYPYLQGIPVVNGVSHVSLLIGQDNSEALVPLEVKRGKKGDPFAVRTMFGWSLNGPASIDRSVGKNVINHFIAAESIEKKVERLWELEKNDSIDDVAWSQDDTKVIQFWDEMIDFKDGHYVLPIPWKDDVSFPNNFNVAVVRLKSLHANLMKKDLFQRYDAEIVKLLQNGFAEKVPVDLNVDLSSKVWYLPHHAVLSDKKPDKLRCAWFSIVQQNFKGSHSMISVFRGLT